MPVGDYLGSEGFSEDLTQTDIELHFSFSEVDRRAVGRHRRAMNRLGIALQIGYLRLTGLPLKSVEMIPEPVLTHLGRELGIAVPRLASIRGFYRRRRTLFEHQAAANLILGLRDLTAHGVRALNDFLRREAGEKQVTEELLKAARGWLIDHASCRGADWWGRPTQIGRIRRELALDRDGAVEILGAVRAIGVEHAPDHPLAQTLVTLERIEVAGDRHLPAGTVNPFGQTWTHLVSQPDRYAALGGTDAGQARVAKWSRLGCYQSGAPCSRRPPNTNLR